MSVLADPLPLIDTHAHLDFSKFEADFEDVLARARAAGLEHIVTIGAGRGVDSMDRALEIARAHDWISATVGVHPHDAKLAGADVLAKVRRLADAPEVVGIGETGLDYFYERSPIPDQKAAFRAFVAIAVEANKPLVVHSRDAEADTISILESEGAGRCGGIIHCFSGTAWLAERALALGFYLSFSGIVTFPNAASVHEVARTAPLDRILVETDAPYLAPVPNRGKRNEPAFVNHTLRRIAQLRGAEPRTLAEATTANARRLFQL